jgi:hypothetical protein
MLRAVRAREWGACFPGEAGEEAYRAVFPRYSPLPWPVVHAAQGDLLRLLVGRVPADLGVPVLLAIAALTREHSKPEAAARAVLATIVNDLRPVHARTVLAALADAWSNAERTAYDRRGALIAQELARSVRRLVTAGADTDGALATLIEQLELDRWP